MRISAKDFPASVPAIKALVDEAFDQLDFDVDTPDPLVGYKGGVWVLNGELAPIKVSLSRGQTYLAALELAQLIGEADEILDYGVGRETQGVDVRLYLRVLWDSEAVPDVTLQFYWDNA